MTHLCVDGGLKRGPLHNIQRLQIHKEWEDKWEGDVFVSIMSDVIR